MSTVKSKGHTESRLVQTLREMFPNLNFTQSDLKNPTRDTVMAFYVEFLHYIGVNTEALNQVTPEMYEKFGDTHVVRKFTIVLHDVFIRILLNEMDPFTMLDILQPTQGRTAAFFSGMSNFVCYVMEKAALIDDYIDELEAEKQKFDSLRKEREALLQQLNDEALARTRVSRLEAEIAAKQQELQSIDEEADAADKVAVEKENALKDLERKVEEVEKDLLEAQQETAKVEALIVRSPLSIKNQKCLLEQKLMEAEEKTDAAKDMLTSKREISKKLEALGEDLDSNTKLLLKIKEESKQIRKDEDVVEELKRKLSKAREDQDESNEVRQKLYEREAQQQEIASGILLRFETKKKESERRIRAMQRELEDILKRTSEEKLSLQNAKDERCGEISRIVNVYGVLCKRYEDLYAALLLKEKAVSDKELGELEEIIAKFSKKL